MQPGQRKKLRRRVLLLRLRRQKRTATEEYVGRPAQTGCDRIGTSARGNSARLRGPEKGHWRGPLLSDIVKILQTTSSKKRTFICIHALDECAAGDLLKLLSSLNRILQKSPRTRIFLTGRPHIRAEIVNRLSGRVTTILITPKRYDVIRYLHSRLAEDTTPDATDSSLEADILQKNS